MGLRGPLAKLYDEQAEDRPVEALPPQPPPQQYYKNLTVNLPLDVLDGLREFAFHHRMKQNEVVRNALVAYMRTHPK